MTREEDLLRAAIESKEREMSESASEQLDRVRLMAGGDDTWDLSDNDLDALRAVLNAIDQGAADIARLKAELAGSQNEAKAFSEALDGMEKTLTETQKALDDTTDLWQFSGNARQETSKCLVIANELLGRALEGLEDVSASGHCWCEPGRYIQDFGHSLTCKGASDLCAEIAAHLKPKEDHATTQDRG